MPFDIIGWTGPGMRQVVRFGDRSMGRGTFGATLGRSIVTNGDFTAYVCYSAATRPSSQITLARLVVHLIDSLASQCRHLASCFRRTKSCRRHCVDYCSCTFTAELNDAHERVDAAEKKHFALTVVACFSDARSKVKRTMSTRTASAVFAVIVPSVRVGPWQGRM